MIPDYGAPFLSYLTAEGGNSAADMGKIGLNRHNNERETAMNSVYLFSVNPDTPPIQTIDPGEEV